MEGRRERTRHEEDSKEGRMVKRKSEVKSKGWREDKEGGMERGKVK